MEGELKVARKKKTAWALGRVVPLFRCSPVQSWLCFFSVQSTAMVVVQVNSIPCSLVKTISNGATQTCVRTDKKYVEIRSSGSSHGVLVVRDDANLAQICVEFASRRTLRGRAE
jgi:hypothetical protein